jgi:hypothetical protein
MIYLILRTIEIFSSFFSLSKKKDSIETPARGLQNRNEKPLNEKAKFAKADFQARKPKKASNKAIENGKGYPNTCTAPQTQPCPVSGDSMPQNATQSSHGFTQAAASVEKRPQLYMPMPGFSVLPLSTGDKSAMEPTAEMAAKPDVHPTAMGGVSELDRAPRRNRAAPGNPA